MRSRLLAVGLSGLLTAAGAQPIAAQSDQPSIDLVVAAGRPLRVALDEKTRLDRVGQPVTGTVTEPVYAYDRIVIAVGTKVRGHVAHIDSGSKFVRARAYLNGNLSPTKHAVLAFVPYFYNAFAQYHYQGTPVIRPMQLAVGLAAVAEQSGTGRLDATTNPYEVPPAVREVKDQYFFGDALLVAPIAPNIKSRKVLLPAGKWYDFYTGKFAGENQTIEVTPSLAQMPVFVKDGSLVPMIGERQWTPTASEVVALEVRHYGELPGQLALYDDDGETFDYEKGNFSWTQLVVTRAANGSLQGGVTPDKNGHAWHYSDVKWTFMSVR